jgi:predicted O-methyltransferase YrrM
MTTLIAHTADAYAAAFEAERQNEYPAIDALEQRFGFALDRERLEAAARILACPLKQNPPNWAHGRVLYALTRAYLATHLHATLVDIGTAKGFSALCLQWALNDSGRIGAVHSCDVIRPSSRERRNTVAELDGLLTLHETLAPWPEAQAINFEQATGVEFLQGHPSRIHIAFVDGKHTGTTVFLEGSLLSARQDAGDIAIFDDVQIDGVDMAVKELRRFYKFEEVRVNDHRAYAIGVRRG